MGALAGLALLTLVALAVATLKPYSNGHATPRSTPAEHGAPAAAQPQTAGERATATPAPAAGSASATASARAVERAPKPAQPAPTHVAPAPTPVAEKTLPERMARTLPGSTQLLIATGARLGSNTGTLEIYNLDAGHWAKVLSTRANFGKTGLTDGATRVSGHLNTPTGIWFIGGFVFGQHVSPPPGTRMPYRHITQNSWWSDENATYNTWVESKSHVSGEHLADSTVQYEYAFDTGYNAPPNQRVIGRGSAIFLHIFEPPGNALGQFTHGCVAISRADMLRVLRLVDPARRPGFAIGTQQAGTPTSIYSY